MKPIRGNILCFVNVTTNPPRIPGSTEQTWHSASDKGGCELIHPWYETPAKGEPLLPYFVLILQTHSIDQLVIADKTTSFHNRCIQRTNFTILIRRQLATIFHSWVVLFRITMQRSLMGRPIYLSSVCTVVCCSCRHTLEALEFIIKILFCYNNGRSKQKEATISVYQHFVVVKA